MLNFVFALFLLGATIIVNCHLHALNGSRPFNIKSSTFKATLFVGFLLLFFSSLYIIDDGSKTRAQLKENFLLELNLPDDDSVVLEKRSNKDGQIRAYTIDSVYHIEPEKVKVFGIISTNGSEISKLTKVN